MKICKIRLTNEGKQGITSFALLVSVIIGFFMIFIGTIAGIELLTKGSTTVPLGSWVVATSIIVATGIWSVIAYLAVKKITTTWFKCKE